VSLVFQSPGWLVLLALVPLVWFVPRRLRDPRHGILRSLCLALLIGGLSRPALLSRGGAEHHTIVVDTSASVAPAARRTAGDAAAAIVAGAARGERVVRIDVGHSAASPLGAALAAALREIPASAAGSVTVFTDGLSTERDVSREVAALSARGVPVHVVPLSAASGPPRPTALEPAGPLRAGHTARLRVDLAGTGSADVRLLGPAGELARADGVLCEGSVSVYLEIEPVEAGFLPLRVLTAEDDASVLARSVPVDRPLSVLHLGGRVGDGGARLEDLLGAGFELDEKDATPTAAQLEQYDVIVVDDRPAASLPDDEQARLVSAVADDGAGLVMCGGGGVFGPGGYHDTPLGDILPVECAQKEEKRDPSTTLVLIIDTSGSMGGTRVQLAKEVARLAIRRLLPHDKVGIVEFYGAKRWAAPIQPASNSIEIERALNRLDAGGGTVILPAIEEAFYGMQNVQTRFKHVLVLTDGGVERGAFEPLLRRMADEGMNVSTVLIGPEAHSEFLVSMSNWGKGRFYNVPNRFNLPELMLKQPTTARLPAYRPGVQAVTAHGGPSWWGDVSPASLPPISGHVETVARPGAEVLVETSAGAHPVLASWAYGLGRVTALTTEPVGPGTATWREWEDYGRVLARVLTRTATRSPPFLFDLHRVGGVVTVRAERVTAHDAQPEIRAVDTAGEQSAPLEMRQRADGVYNARVRAEPGKDLWLAAGVAGLPGSRLRLVSPAVAEAAHELQVDPRHALDLTALAEATGGDVVELSAAAAFRPRAAGGVNARTATSLLPLAWLLAILAYLADVLHRRLPRRAREPAA